MTPQEIAELGKLVRETTEMDTARDFRPCAIFDDGLDCIRVIARDTSFTEIRIDGRLTILEDNYPYSEARKYVGFTIKGARHFCQENGLSLAMPVRLAEVLDALFRTSPPAVQVVIDRVAKPLIQDERIDSVSFGLQPATT